ncbi:MAG: hypothetical protein ACFFBY_15300 [Promethearchaeota archaeon]
MKDESQVIERIYGVNVFNEKNEYVPDKSNKAKHMINEIYVNNSISAKAKKRIFIGLQLLIIAAHIAFFILRMFHI